MALNSHQTAIAIIPPQNMHSPINELRALHDKAYSKWPIHMNVLYPFVPKTHLPEAISKLRVALQEYNGGSPFQITLDRAGIFEHKNSATHFLASNEETTERLKGLRECMLEALGIDEAAEVMHREYNPHFTVGQTSRDKGPMDSLFSKVEKLAALPLSWEVFSLSVLERGDNGDMSVVGDISFSSLNDVHGVDIPGEASPEIPQESKRCFVWNEEADAWLIDEAESVDSIMPQQWNVATYNAMIDYRPATERYPLLIKAIEAAAPLHLSLAAPAVLCLQEVSDGFLTHLLSQPGIKKRYPYCSHGPTSVLPSVRNCVILASVGFDWGWLPFPARHKGAIVASFAQLALANVHLSVGLSSGSVAAKISQMKVLTTHLQKNFAEKEWFVAGDFNIMTSTRTIEAAIVTRGLSPATVKNLNDIIDSDVFVDAWDLAYLPNEEDPFPHAGTNDFTKHEGEYGATFDRLTNSLAAELVQAGVDPRPQRYDRILLKRSGKTAVQEVSRFGFPTLDGACSSDHYGVRAIFNVSTPSKSEDTIARLQTPSDNTDLRPFFKERMPSASDKLERTRVLQVLKKCIEQSGVLVDQDAPTTPVLPIIIAALGSHALDLYEKDADVDCLCVSVISRKTFFQLARQRIRKFGARDGIKIVRFVNAIVPMLELQIMGIKVDLQYSQAPSLLPRWSEIPQLSPTDPLFTLPPQSLKTLNAYRDAQFLLRTIPNLKSFRLAHRFIKTCLKNAGLYASRFGFLGGIHLTLLLARISKLADKNPTLITAAELVRLFFQYYAGFHWEGDVVTDPSMDGWKNRYKRSAREALVILSIHIPTVRLNVAQNATKQTVRTLQAYFERSCRLLEEGDWKGLVGSSKGYVDEFLAASQSFVKIDVQCWRKGGGKFRGLVGWIESRCPLLLIDLYSTLPQLYARIWPARFRDISDDGDTEIRGFYLIGLSPAPDTAGMEKVDKNEANNQLILALRTFEEQLKATTLYEPACSWLQVSLVRRSSLVNVEVDTRDLGAEDEYSGDEDEEVNESSASSEQVLPIRPAVDSLPIGSGKLRPIHHVLNRLRHDQGFDIADYVVGYEDRFVGVREMPVERWKTEQTELEFIPLHRVVYFRRKSDGVFVWDRERKIDLIFGV